MKMLKSIVLGASLALGLAACDSQPPQSETERFNTFLDERFDFWVGRSPTWQSYLGIKDDYGQWDDESAAADDEDQALYEEDLKLLREFDVSTLDAQAQISYRLYDIETERHLHDYRFRFHGYPVNQMFGWQADMPAFLINIHRIADVSDAESYISRLSGVHVLFTQVMERMRIAQDMGILPPKFVFAHVLRDSANVVTGRPYDDSGDDSTLLADFRKKVAALTLDAGTEADLIARAEQALLKSVAPAYRDLIALVEEQQAAAGPDDGAWKHPDGEAYYRLQLTNITTTNLSASEIHDLGLSEVARIHDEMSAIMAAVNFEGDLQAFFTFMRESEQFYLPNTEEGRATYLEKTNTLIADMKSRLDEVFATKPEADLDVKPVEAFREQSAGKAFYQSPSPTGDRPGRYYVNLYDMAAMPIYELDALAYHEAIPGHHVQIAIAQEKEGLPKFRKYGGFTAYVEGWGLYAEKLPKEMGLYEDPYADFGRLSMELWRACRLVVDTGMHDKRWTREQAIDYLKQNTPAPEYEVTKSIERYIVMPGQATAYKIGMLKILELREWARGELGEAFDIRAFHDAVLGNGALPLTVLEEQVQQWVAGVKA